MTLPEATPIGITMGDPSGIGPELCVKLIAGGGAAGLRVFVLGDIGLFSALAESYAGPARILPITAPEECPVAESGVVPVLQAASPLPLPPATGKVSAISGQAAYDCVITAIDLCRAGRIAAMVTAPLHKEALSAAGIAYPGHTEILSDKGGAPRVAMMLANDELRTVLVTIHCSLRQAIERVTFDAELETIRIAAEGARQFGIENPRVAVAGLNPHAGEGGLFGSEEDEIIAPAIAAAQAEGINVTGPWPGDTVFMQARTGRFDVVVAQYHDQGLIPVKYMGLENGVNVTLGLPFIRTSPDHGTAFDIAGKWIADEASLKTALDQAVRLVRSKAAMAGAAHAG